MGGTSHVSLFCNYLVFSFCQMKLPLLEDTDTYLLDRDGYIKWPCFGGTIFLSQYIVSVK
jgi:hypothetical protein